MLPPVSAAEVGLKILNRLLESNKYTYLLSTDGEHPQQRWFCGDQEAESHPSQSHCHSGSKVEFAPKVKGKTNSMNINMKTFSDRTV